MKTRLYVPIRPRALSELVRLAVRERRRVHQQAAVMLEQALGVEADESAGEEAQKTAWKENAEPGDEERAR